VYLLDHGQHVLAVPPAKRFKDVALRAAVLHDSLNLAETVDCRYGARAAWIDAEKNHSVVSFVGLD
jgi:hypothetical protein